MIEWIVAAADLASLAQMDSGREMLQHARRAYFRVVPRYEMLLASYEKAKAELVREMAQLEQAVNDTVIPLNTSVEVLREQDLLQDATQRALTAFTAAFARTVNAGPPFDINVMYEPHGDAWLGKGDKTASDFEVKIKAIVSSARAVDQLLPQLLKQTQTVAAQRALIATVHSDFVVRTTPMIEFFQHLKPEDHLTFAPTWGACLNDTVLQYVAVLSQVLPCDLDALEALSQNYYSHTAPRKALYYADGQAKLVLRVDNDGNHRLVALEYHGEPSARVERVRGRGDVIQQRFDTLIVNDRHGQPVLRLQQKGAYLQFALSLTEAELNVTGRVWLSGNGSFYWRNIRVMEFMVSGDALPSISGHLRLNPSTSKRSTAQPGELSLQMGHQQVSRKFSLNKKELGGFELTTPTLATAFYNVFQPKQQRAVIDVAELLCHGIEQAFADASLFWESVVLNPQLWQSEHGLELVNEAPIHHIPPSSSIPLRPRGARVRKKDAPRTALQDIAIAAMLVLFIANFGTLVNGAKQLVNNPLQTVDAALLWVMDRMPALKPLPEAEDSAETFNLVDTIQPVKRIYENVPAEHLVYQEFAYEAARINIDLPKTSVTGLRLDDVRVENDAFIYRYTLLNEQPLHSEPLWTAISRDVCTNDLYYDASGFTVELVNGAGEVVDSVREFEGEC